MIALAESGLPRPGEHRQPGRVHAARAGRGGDRGHRLAARRSSSRRCRPTTRRSASPTSRWPASCSAGSPRSSLREGLRAHDRRRRASRRSSAPRADAPGRAGAARGRAGASTPRDFMVESSALQRAGRHGDRRCAVTIEQPEATSSTAERRLDASGAVVLPERDVRRKRPPRCRSCCGWRRCGASRASSRCWRSTSSAWPRRCSPRWCSRLSSRATPDVRRRLARQRGTRSRSPTCSRRCCSPASDLYAERAAAPGPHADRRLAVPGRRSSRWSSRWPTASTSPATTSSTARWPSRSSTSSALRAAPTSGSPAGCCAPAGYRRRAVLVGSGKHIEAVAHALGRPAPTRRSSRRLHLADAAPGQRAALARRARRPAARCSTPSTRPGGDHRRPRLPAGAGGRARRQLPPARRDRARRALDDGDPDPPRRVRPRAVGAAVRARARRCSRASTSRSSATSTWSARRCCCSCSRPLLLAIALAVQLTSRGPVLYRSARPGIGGKPFRCFKFRTMRDDADELQADLESLNEVGRARASCGTSGSRTARRRCRAAPSGRSTGPREVSLTASATPAAAATAGAARRAATTRSNVRLIAKSMPSKTGGRSVNSGSVWPGTNSARCDRIPIVDGATWTVDAALVADWSTSSTACSCGKSGSAMITSWTRCRPGSRRGRRAAERAQPVVRPRRQRDVADDSTRRGRVGERMRDRFDVLARADQHRAAPVAGGAQQQAGDASWCSQRSADDVDDREEQRAVEDVVAGEVLAAGQREDQRDDRHLEQRRRRSARARAAAARSAYRSERANSSTVTR